MAFFFAVDLALLILGMFINTSTIQLVFFPIFIPIAKMLGINLVQFGVTTTLVLMIGLSSPPYGTMLFMVSGLAKVPLGAIIRELLPQISVLIIIAIIMTLFPEVILFIPRLMRLI
jgi:TRAP-type C4-dicarboxylate transport system permease large subunit